MAYVHVDMHVPLMDETNSKEGICTLLIRKKICLRFVNHDMDCVDSDVNTSTGFIFFEVGSIQATSVNCCQISSDGKLVAVGGQDKKTWRSAVGTKRTSIDRKSGTPLDSHSLTHRSHLSPFTDSVWKILLIPNT